MLICVNGRKVGNMEVQRDEGGFVMADLGGTRRSRVVE
ncbi:hypothetical protein A2U01_0008000, partial [Trifolium medium]|nr:hypothetical protein [Trifolium medium]